jgi:hypothetical protein
MKVDPDAGQSERNRMEASRVPKDLLKSGSKVGLMTQLMVGTDTWSRWRKREMVMVR